jgi:hypothetical protein
VIVTVFFVIVSDDLLGTSNCDFTVSAMHPLSPFTSVTCNVKFHTPTNGERSKGGIGVGAGV